MIAEIKEQLRPRWACCRCALLRERARASSSLPYDNNGQKNYGTAGYLGHGYFVTVKHAVVVLQDEATAPGTRKITALKIVYKGKEFPAR